MYEKIIKQLGPKPHLDLTWYEGEDKYSEGEAEDLVLSLIAQNPPEEYVEAIYKNYNWSTYYHLSHIRQNILNWYNFGKDSNVLEIGCGMGAITGMLCDRVKSVTAVEMSKRRATATLLRCREKDNLRIIVGNLNDIKFEEKFDYITLIGVLEYQGSYTNSENPYIDFVKKIKSLLKPNGRLLVAIENRYGLKYFCGAYEDHTGIPFDGINGYRLTNKKVKTFSKTELTELFKTAGFGDVYFYYPMPDYKLPTVVYSQDYLPQNGNMQNMRPYYVPNDLTCVADEKILWNDVVENNAFEFMSNSFLVDCGEECRLDEEGRISFASLSTARLSAYRIGTRFIDNTYVEKFLPALNQKEDHIDKILKNEKELKQNGINVLEGKRDKSGIRYDFIKQDLLENVVLKLLESGRKEDILDLFDKIFCEIEKSSEECSAEENIIFTFGLNVPKEKELYGKILKTAFLDMILRNAFYVEEEIIWFDQEWTLENTPASFVMFRLLKEFWLSFPEAEILIHFEEMLERYHIIDLVSVYSDMESLFIGAVIDKMHLEESACFAYKKDNNNIVKNIKKIMM